MKKKRLAWFTANPSGNVFSKGAYLSDVLLPLLGQQLEIELFCREAGQTLGGLVSKNFLTANLINKSRPFDFYLYNFENQAFCNFIRIQLGLKPGITWFHDFNLFDDGPEPILNSPWSRMLSLFRQPDSLNLWPGIKDQFIPGKPAAVREIGMSLFSLFSNERDLAQFRSTCSDRLNPADSGVFLPLPLKDQAFEITCQENQIVDNVLALCSEPCVDSHVHSLFSALRVLPQIKLRWLINRTDKAKCEELITEFGLKNVEIVEGKTMDTWLAVLAGCKFSVHFLYSFYDQLQPWLAASMAQGKHCLVLNFGEIEHLPEQAVIKIDCGRFESEEIKRILSELTKTAFSSDKFATAIASERYDLNSIAAEFMLYLEQISPQYLALCRQWEKLEICGRNRVIESSIVSTEDYQKQHFVDVYRNLGWK